MSNRKKDGEGSIFRRPIWRFIYDYNDLWLAFLLFPFCFQMIICVRFKIICINENSVLKPRSNWSFFFLPLNWIELFKVFSRALWNIFRSLLKNYERKTMGNGAWLPMEILSATKKMKSNRKFTLDCSWLQVAIEEQQSINVPCVGTIKGILKAENSWRFWSLCAAKTLKMSSLLDLSLLDRERNYF